MTRNPDYLMNLGTNARRQILRLARALIALATRVLRCIPSAARWEYRRYDWIEARLHADGLASSSAPAPYLPPLLFPVQECIAQRYDYQVLFLNNPAPGDADILALAGINRDWAAANGADSADPGAFQLAAVTAGYMAGVCPWTGSALRSKHAFIAAQRQPIFYRFRASASGRVLYLAVGREGAGYTKLYLYIPDARLVVFLGPAVLWNGRDEIDQIRAFMIVHWRRCRAYLESSTPPLVTALVDSSHFAHHLWEDLSGLAGAVRAGHAGGLDQVLVAAEPLLAIDRLFPELTQTQVVRRGFPELPLLALAQQRLLVRLGAVSIDESVIERVKVGVAASLSPAVKAHGAWLRAQCWPILWVSVRSNNRTWVSAVHGLAAIANALHQDYPRLGLIIDGYCLPYDLDDAGRARLDTFVARDLDCVNGIHSRLAPGIQVHTTVGTSMAEGLFYTAFADCYLAHHGSLQHKISWMRNCPGAVHSNRLVLAAAPTAYPGLNARVDACLPVYLSPDAVEDRGGAEGVANYRWDYDLDNYDFDYHLALEALRDILRSLPPGGTP